MPLGREEGREGPEGPEGVEPGGEAGRRGSEESVPRSMSLRKICSFSEKILFFCSGADPDPEPDPDPVMGKEFGREGEDRGGDECEGEGAEGMADEEDECEEENWEEDEWEEAEGILLPLGISPPTDALAEAET